MTRRFGAGSDDVPCRAAAGGHSRRRRRSPVGPGAVPAASSRPSGRTAACCARSAQAPKPPRRPDGAFRSLPGGLSQMVRALAARLPAGRRPSRTRAVRRVIARRRRRRSRRNARPATRLDAARGHLSRRRRTSTGALCCASIDAELARSVRRGPVRVDGDRRAGVSTRPTSAHPLNGSGFVVPARRSGPGILAASWLSSKWPHRAPDGSRADARRSSAARAIRTRSDSPTRELVRHGRSRRSAAPRHHRRSAADARVPVASAPARSTKSATWRASRRSTRAGAASRACSSPAVDFAAWGFRTAWRTAARRREAGGTNGSADRHRPSAGRGRLVCVLEPHCAPSASATCVA